MSKDECMELKNLKYQTMLLNNNTKIKETQPNILNIENFLQKEKENNISKPWNKLGKGTKLKKLYEYVDDFLKDKPEKKQYEVAIKNYLLDCLDRKKLQKKKDVIYDIENNKIKSIPNLYFNEKRNKYTLKRTEKKSSTLKSLPTRKNKSSGKKHIKKKKRNKNSKIKEKKRKACGRRKNGKSEEEEKEKEQRQKYRQLKLKIYKVIL